ncbi:putative serine/threonine-protein kinase abkC [Drosera capensis]
MMLGNIVRAANHALKIQRSNYCGLRRNDLYVGLRPPQTQSYSAFRGYYSHWGYKTSAMYKDVKYGFQSASVRNYTAVYPSNVVSHHVVSAWRRLSQLRPANGPAFSPLVRAAQAFSLASTRSHIPLTGIFAFLFGELAMAQKAGAEADCAPGNIPYMTGVEEQPYILYLLSSCLEAMFLFVRTLYLAILFSPSIAMAPFADKLGPDFRKLWLQVVHGTLEKAGPAFIKWGQWAATRPDLFPRDLCTELSKLHTNAPEHSFAYTKRTVEKAFGRKISEIFDSFDELPLASGSIAQVHRATLRFRYPGQKVKPIEVAVKVRHPGVGESIRKDFVIINSVAKISNYIPTLQWLRLDESVQQFAVFMMSQVDLSREAAHLNRFLYNFRSWRDVSFPKPLYPLVHPAVLVETFEQGESVAHYIEEIEGHDRVRAALADIGTNALLKMLLVDNFIHADMHPGNILVRVIHKNSHRRKIRKSKPHVVFIDVGMTAELSKGDRGNLLEFFKAVARRDGRTAAECALSLSKQQSCPDPEAFIQEVKESFDFWGTPEGDLVHPADCMHHLLDQVRRHKVNIDGNVCTVIVTTLVLEGWQRKLDPHYDMMKTLQTLLFKVDWAESLSYTIESIMAP